MAASGAARISGIVLTAEGRHRLYVYLAAGFLLTLIVSVLIYGWDYYWLDPAQRVFMAKHSQLRPSGSIGIKLGILGPMLLLRLVPVCDPQAFEDAWQDR